MARGDRDFRDTRREKARAGAARVLNVTAGGTPGTEPEYSYDATVLRLFFSGWF